MWRNALLATVTVLAGMLILIMSQLDFLIPYKRPIIARWQPILIYISLLAINLFGAFFWFTRKFLLKETGRKLEHLEKQLGPIHLEQ